MNTEKHYVITFYKTVTDDYGHDRELEQSVIEVEAADEQVALVQAKDEFCRRRDLHHWSLHADRYEIRLEDIEL